MNAQDEKIFYFFSPGGAREPHVAPQCPRPLGKGGESNVGTRGVITEDVALPVPGCGVPLAAGSSTR